MKARKDRLNLSFGVLAEKLSFQLKDFGLPELELNNFQRDADAITRLSIRGLLSESTAKNARLKLLGKIHAEMIKLWLHRLN